MSHKDNENKLVEQLTDTELVALGEAMEVSVYLNKQQFEEK